MKIKRISTIVTSVPLGKKKFFSSQAMFPERTSFLVRIESDNGLIGWGEGGQWGPSSPVASVIGTVFVPKLLGEEILQPSVIWEKLYTYCRDFGSKGTYIEAMSAIDIALWDLMGQYLKIPIHSLLGGAFRTEIKPYATGFYYRDTTDFSSALALELLADEAKSYIDDGFLFLKVKIGMAPLADDIKRVEAIRKVVGDEITLMADPNHAYNVSNALLIGRDLQALGVKFFEEPVVPEDLEGYRMLRKSLDMAIAGGECEYTRFGFRELIGRGCVDIVQPDICAAGGFSEFLKISALASAHNVMVLPHVWGSGISVAASLHAIASTPWQPYTYLPIPLQNDPVVEFDRNYNPLRDDLIEPAIKRLENSVFVPTGPGLGITVNEDRLAKYISAINHYD